MEATEWQIVEHHFHIITELEESEKNQYILKIYQESPQIHDQIQKLLEASKKADDMFESPIFQSPKVDWNLFETSSLTEESTFRSSPQAINQIEQGLTSICKNTPSPKFILIARIAKGGMGVVYHAEQQHPIRRQVALKVVRKRSKDSQTLLTSFESERQSLAAMNHDNIAKIYDAGNTEEGIPYFTMEYIPGKRITDFCRIEKLGLTERLKLFLQVCDGVLHAHQRGIIHRDIKPNNILVTLQGEKAIAKVIDFGIAKVIQSPDSKSDKGECNQQLIGTPPYISPEQTFSNDHRVDTRSDIYALGAVLYRLTTTYQIFPVNQLSPDEIIENIRNERPMLPSKMIINAMHISEEFGIKPKKLSNMLSGDMNAIIMKALEKNPEDRYKSIELFKQDIERFLNSIPISVRPHSSLYLLRKRWRRNRIQVTGFAVAASATLAVFFSIVMAYFQISAAKKKVDEGISELRLMNGFYTDLIASPHPYSKGSEVLLIDVLMEGSNKIQNMDWEKTKPRMAGLVYDNLARSLHMYGQFEEAERYFGKAITLLDKNLEPESTLLLEVETYYGYTLREQGKYAKAKLHFEQLLEKQEQILGTHHPLYLKSSIAYAGILARSCESETAVNLAEQAYQITAGRQGSHHLDTLLAAFNLGDVLINTGYRAKAADLYGEILADAEKITNMPQPVLLDAKINYAHALANLQREDEAENIFCNIIYDNAAKPFLSEISKYKTLSGLAYIYLIKRELTRAEQLSNEALTGFIQTLGSYHPRTQEVKNNHGLIIQSQRRYPEALFWFEEMYAYPKADEPVPRFIHQSTHNQADTLRLMKSHNDALPLIRYALELRVTYHGWHHEKTLLSLATLGEIYLEMGQYREAQLRFEKALQLAEDTSGMDLTLLNVIRSYSAYSLVHMGQWETARSLLREGIRQTRELGGSPDILQKTLKRIEGWYSTRSKDE